MTIELLHPWFLLIILGSLVVWVGPLRTRDFVHGCARTAFVLFIAIAAAHPVIMKQDARPTQVWILDQSSSVQPAETQRALHAMEQAANSATDSDHVLVYLGADHFESDVFDRVISVNSSGDDGSSPIATALHVAATMLPQEGTGALWLATDGLATRDDNRMALNALRRRGIPIHQIPLDAVDSVRPVALNSENELRVGSTAHVEVVLDGMSGPCRVVLASNDELLAEAEVESVDGRTLVPLTFEPTNAGFLHANITIEGAAAAPSLDVVLSIQSPRRLAYIGRRQRNGADRLRSLLGRGFEITEPSPTDAAAICAADLVLLDDVDAKAFPEEVQQAIAHAVTNDGLGMMMSGGRSSFGAGGWHDTTLESLMPVEFVQKEEKRDPSTTLAIVIDTSGSMAGQRVQLAKEVARLAIRRLMPHDKVGIVEFFGAKRWAAPIQPASNAIEIERALNRLDAGGGTVILPALEEAFYGMQNIDTRYKHVLVLTDGGVEAGAFEPLLRRMAAEGINVSSVLVGGGIHSEFLVNLSNWGKGRYYSVPNRFNLPEIIFKQPSSAKLPTYREGAHEVTARGGEGWWSDADVRNIPALSGYVESQARTGAEIIAETTQGGHPVLASWRHGLGRVTSFMSEPVGDGTSAWSDWSDYGRALARICQRTAADNASAFLFEARPDGRDVLVTATRRAGRAPGVVPSLLLHEDDGDPQSIAMRQRTTSQWTARLASAPKDTSLRLSGGRLGDEGGSRTYLAAPSTLHAELLVDSIDAAQPEAIARLTGGSIFDRDTRLTVDQTTRGGWYATSWQPLLFGLALLAFLFELGWRRRP